MTLLKRNITKDQSRDTGMAMVLLLLILYTVSRRPQLVIAAMALQVLDMTVPKIFRPVAMVWLGLSELLGHVMSTILLSLVYFLFVTPLGMIRRALGKDSLQLRAFKASEESVMLKRDHTFVRGDLETPY
jgi:hypothetical protein